MSSYMLCLAVYFCATVYHAITQGQFLMNLGIISRVERLINLPSVSEDQAELLYQSFSKLVAEEEMGKRFKVLGIASPGLNVAGFPPDGFTQGEAISRSQALNTVALRASVKPKEFLG
jgi:hypothetical protein